ncbi:hypothetical protein QYM36_001152 [Artemia franciscana]|uniref:Ribosome biogenesis protein BRX1 homolog n=1 Tax=Artemia franciscana TaxID=6661 RepID=A0AA88LHW7_ARTSF|nr:hypothetical protein QYM36_001152 [Artemia franciscana]
MPKRGNNGLPYHLSKKFGLGDKSKSIKKREQKKKNVKVQKTKPTDEQVLVRAEPEEISVVPNTIHRGKWRNKQRVLVFAARGITHRDRHLMLDLKNMFPHSKSESKMEKKDPHLVVNEICETRNCSKVLYFECRKKQDLYMWMSNVPSGPSAKFLIENIHTSGELKMAGNCLKGSRPLLSFDSNFDSSAHWSLLKELLVQIFGTPNNHPKSQPFFDHVFSFTVFDNRIWFRNFQILEEDGQLVEIGPRFVMNPIKIFEGSFNGQVLWENRHYVSPNLKLVLSQHSFSSVALPITEDSLESRNWNALDRAVLSKPFPVGGRRRSLKEGHQGCNWLWTL